MRQEMLLFLTIQNQEVFDLNSDPQVLQERVGPGPRVPLAPPGPAALQDVQATPGPAAPQGPPATVTPRSAWGFPTTARDT